MTQDVWVVGGVIVGIFATGLLAAAVAAWWSVRHAGKDIVR